jgi:hypothetical protein
MTSGYIESYGYFSVAEGWLLCGWVAQGWTEDHVPSRVVPSFENGNVEGETLAIPYRRHDVPSDGEGVIFFIHNRAASLNGCAVKNLRSTQNACRTDRDADNVRYCRNHEASTFLIVI